MKISKNKIVKWFSIVFIGSILIIITELKDDMPEDKKLSSGYSVFMGPMGKINNYQNVKNYAYKTKKKEQIGRTILHLKDISFSFLEEIDVNNRSNSVIETEQYPQGLCITDEYVMITSYSEDKNRSGELKIFERDTGEQVVTFGMDGNSHLGGITYDGTYIWVCNSAKMALERISYKSILSMINNHRGAFIDITNLVDVYPVKNIPSCITFYKGHLWIATHTKWTNSKMIEYYYDKEKDAIISLAAYKIPEKVQGVTFGEDESIFLSISYGRRNSSFIKSYTSIYSMTKDVENYIKLIEMPPCSEELVWLKNRLYILFESAGRKYLEGTDGNGKGTAPLDKILIIDLTST